MSLVVAETATVETRPSGGLASVLHDGSADHIWALVETTRVDDEPPRAHAVMAAFVGAFGRAGGSRDERLAAALVAAREVDGAVDVVAFALDDDRMVTGRLGAARCYRLRAGNLAILTRGRPGIVERSPAVCGDVVLLASERLSSGIHERELAELFVHRASMATLAKTVAWYGERRGGTGGVVALQIDRGDVAAD